MKLENYLVLNKYFLSLFGFDAFEELSKKLQDIEVGYDTQGKSFFIDVIKGLKKGWEPELLKYDEAIKEYVERLRKNRGQPNFNLKYFQYLPVLFTEIFLDKYYHSKQIVLNELNEYLEKFNNMNKTNITYFKEEDLKKLAFWMATGSGKTLLMHINYWQMLKYTPNGWDNIILITSNEELSKQHYEELRLSGIPCKLYDGNFNSLKTKDKEILVIDIHKLTQEKRGEGVSVDISYFDGKNLVFIDEGHEGQKSEEQKWKKLREEIGKNGFLFEYSATFGQTVGKNKDLLDEYAKAIIFNYSYKYFYNDGYGKDFYVYNMKKENRKKDEYTEEEKDLLLTAGLLSFYEQLEIFEKNQEEAHEYNIEKPLWIFVGSRVTGSGINSDIVRVIKFLRRIIEEEDYLKKNIEKILTGKSGLLDAEKNDIFEEKFNFVRKNNIDSITEGIYEKIFDGKGKLEVYEIKSAKGELGLKTSISKKYFGVINVGDASELKKLLEKTDIKVQNDNFSTSLFADINKPNSHIKILIGAKKFIAGWNSWRISTMGLINIGQNEGPQIIQLFGRGVRLKGKNYSLKREENPSYELRTLQTLFIFGLNADYINAFLSAIANEGVDYREIVIPIKFKNPEEWEEKIYTIKVRDDFDFLNHPIKITLEEEVLKGIKIDLTPRVITAQGLKIETAESNKSKPIMIPKEYFDIIDWNFIYSEIMNYKILKRMYNLIIDIDTLRQVITSNGYEIFLNELEGITVEEDNRNRVLKIYSFSGIKKFHELILMVLKDYILKFYKKEERKKTMEYLEAEPLTIDNHLSMYPEDKKIILKIPRKLKEEFEEVMNQLQKYKPESNELPETWEKWDSFIVHLDNHLYTPLIIWKENKKEIKSIPVKLNKGETKFLEDFKNLLIDNKDLFKDHEIFLLRNLSKRGVGFFINSGFYPDFIVWIKKENKQHMIFIDPKGIKNLGNFNDDKIQLCVSYIKEIDERINKELKEKGQNVNLQLDAFILSVSSYNDIKDTFGEGQYSKKDFEGHNIIFQEDSQYLEKIFKKIGVIKEE